MGAGCLEGSHEDLPNEGPSGLGFPRAQAGISDSTAEFHHQQSQYLHSLFFPPLALPPPRRPPVPRPGAQARAASHLLVSGVRRFPPARSGHRWRRRKAEARPLGFSRGPAQPAPPHPSGPPLRLAALSCRAPPPAPALCPARDRRAPRPGRLRWLPPRGSATPASGRAFRGDSGPATKPLFAGRAGREVRCALKAAPHPCTQPPALLLLLPSSVPPPLRPPRVLTPRRREGCRLGADKGSRPGGGLRPARGRGRAPGPGLSTTDSHWAAGAAWGRGGGGRRGRGRGACPVPAPPPGPRGACVRKGGRGQVTGPGTHPTPTGAGVNLLFCSSPPLQVLTGLDFRSFRKFIISFFLSVIIH